MRMPRTALGPVISLAVAALFLLLSTLSASMATMHDQVSDGETTGDRGTATRYVAIRTIYNVDPGDHVEISAQWNDGLDVAARHTKILIVEGGEGAAYLSGSAASHVLLETSYPKADGHMKRFIESEYGPLFFRFERPAIYDGKPHVQGLNGDLHDAIDLVFLYDRPAQMTQAQWDQSRNALHQSARQVSYTVAKEPWVALQWVFVPAAILSAAATVATGVAWLKGRRPVAAPAESLEQMVQLHGQAFSYLLMLRNSMRVSGVLLAVGGLGSLLALNSLAQNLEYEPWMWWEALVFFGSVILWLTAMAVWTIQHRRIGREIQRWQESKSPLDA
jgi:hypothetical protein